MSKESKLPGWTREGPLWTYHKPLTARERWVEHSKLRESWLQKMGGVSCPECGSTNYEETLMGFFFDEEHYHDPNRRTCCGCGHQWYLSCPTCAHVGR
jgi:hypothetical protein